MSAALLIAVGVFSGAAAPQPAAEASPPALTVTALTASPSSDTEPAIAIQVLAKMTHSLPLTAAMPVELDPLTAKRAVWRDAVSGVEMAMRLTAGAFPPLPEDSGEGRRIVYSNSQQRVWLVGADGFVLDSYLVSGRRNTPRPATHKVFSKSKLAYSTGGVTMRHMVRFARGTNLAIGFHEIPRYRSGRPIQTEEQLGTFRSAGCIRQAALDAERLYVWADIGTTVVVTP